MRSVATKDGKASSAAARVNTPVFLRESVLSVGRQHCCVLQPPASLHRLDARVARRSARDMSSWKSFSASWESANRIA